MTHPEYSRRMNRVLDYIDQHLDTPLELDDLAAIANFSAFHFHRVFSAWLGETLGGYLSRRRLEVGAMRLAANPGESVLSIALSVGFGSGEAFSRAFKRKFACAPSAWRSQTPQRWATQLAQARRAHLEHHSNLDQARIQDSTNHQDSPTLVKSPDMEVRISEMPAKNIAYMRCIGVHGNAIADFWNDVFGPWSAAHGLDDKPRYGIVRDDPSITAPDQCRYDCCVEVPDGFVASKQIALGSLPGGTYVQAQFEGTAPMVANAWTEMLRGWLPSSGLQWDARPFFNHYPENTQLDPDSGVFRCALCMPVRPL